MDVVGGERREVLRLDREGSASVVTDTIVREEPLRISVQGPEGPPHQVVTTMRTPGTEHDLALGWLITEGLAVAEDVVRVTMGDPVTTARPENEVTVHLRRMPEPGRLVARHTVVSPSCGVCGRATLDDLTDRFGDAPPTPRPSIDPRVVARLPELLRREQRLFDATGGVHAAGAFTRDGTPIAVREDVGRHNALDALVGALATAGRLPLEDGVVVLSGRIALELVVKVRAAGSGMLVAVGAPTTLAISAALRLGVTIVGFARDGRCTAYTLPERLTGSGPIHAGASSGAGGS